MKRQHKAFAALGAVLLMGTLGAQAASATDVPRAVDQFEGITEEEWLKLTEESEQILGSGTDTNNQIEIPDSPTVSDKWTLQAELPNGALVQVPDQDTKRLMESVPSSQQRATAAAGTWYPVSDSWIPPSSWRCAPTHSNGTMALALCVVKVGNAVQPAAVMQSLSGLTLNGIQSTQYLEQQGSGLPVIGFGTCPSAYFVPYGRAACSIPGGYTTTGVRNNGNVYGWSITGFGYITPWYY